MSEIRYGAWTLEYFAGLSDKIEGSTIPVPGNRLNYTLRQPLGVTAHIVPWNFPLQLAIRSIAPALAAGCTVVIRPTDETPLTALAIARLAEIAGFPKGVLNLILGKKFLVTSMILKVNQQLRKVIGHILKMFMMLQKEQMPL